MTTLKLSLRMLSARTPLLGIALCSLLVFMTGCGAKDQPEDSTNGETAGLSAEEIKAREGKASSLAQQASKAPRPDKVVYLRRLVGYYPESKYAPQAHSELILYLLHPELDKPEEAWEATETFAERHPNDARACEAYSWMHKHWRDKDPKRAASILNTWAAFLDEALEADTFDELDHKAAFVFARSEVAFESGNSAHCEKLLKQVANWDLKEKGRKLTSVFRLGNLLAARGETEEAKAYYEQALTLIADGARGPTVEVVQAEIKKLNG